VKAIRDRLEDPEGAARRAIGNDVFGQRHAEGEAMLIDDAVAYALSGGDSPDDAEMEDKWRCLSQSSF
jgi:hypothetical protein